MAGDDALLIGVDVGTTNTKAVVFDRTGATVSSAGAPTPTHYPRPGWAFSRPEELWNCVVSALRDATGRLEDVRQVAGIAVASVAEAGVPLDSHGAPTSDSIAWFDRRTGPQLEHLREVVGDERLIATTGLPMQPIASLCKMLWLKDHEPEAWGRATMWLNIADYIAFRLCGEAATDYSLGSRMLAMDLKRLEWSHELVSAAGIVPGVLAPLCPSGTALGTVTTEAAEATGLHTRVLVSTGGHDHICGALAAGVTEPGTMLDSLGTAEALFLALGEPLAGVDAGRSGYAQGAHVAPGKHYVLGGIYTSGASVDWVCDTVAEGVERDVLIREARAAPPGSLGVAFLPHLRLANAPNPDAKARGAFVGLTTDVERGALVRAVFEGLALEFRRCVEPLLAHAGMEGLRDIYAIGGGARNELLMRIKATVMNQTFAEIGVAEAASLGAAILAGLGAGVYEDVPSALAEITYETAHIEPMTEHVETYDLLYRRVYAEMYDTLRPLHRALHDLSS